MQNPSPLQVRRAITRAEHSRSLWATINICNTSRYRNTLGVRGQMPTLGFPAWLSMRIEVEYYSSSAKRFLADQGSTKLIRLGRSSSGLQQGGALYTYAPPTPRLEAKVVFVWRRLGRLLGSAAVTTTAGHHNADYGSPPHFSAAQCRIS